jgi:hypothetical protein
MSVTAGSITSSTLFAPAAVNRGARIKAAVGILLIACFAMRTFASWRSWGDLDHASGTWIAMAIDVRDGILYRPIVSELGYGGTRYAPLHALIQGGMLKLGIDALISGYLIGIVSAALLAAGTFALMRRLGAAPADALLMCCFLLSAHCLAVGVAGIRGDLLAAALDICGVAAVAGSAIALAGILFVLALATKVTCIFGIIASMIWLSCTGRRRAAIQLAVIWLAGATAILAMTQWASHGRALGIFLACADGGGQLMTLLLAPLAMVNNAIHFDPIALAFLLLALLLLPGNIRRSSLPAILLLVTLAGTVAIFGTPGTNINHLIDLHAAVLVFLVTGGRAARLAGLARNLPLALACVGAVLCLQQAWHMQLDSRRATVAAVLDDVAHSPVRGPILSENPLLPIAANQRPYLLDAFMFRVHSARQPSIAAKMWDDMQRRRFAAVVIYARHSFGREFMDRLQTTYFLQDRHDDYEIYLPHPR